MAVAILAVSSDGKLAKREMDGLKSILVSSELFRKVEDPGEYIRHIASSLIEKEYDDVLDAVTALLSPSLRETAYAWAVYMVAVDRKQVGPEHFFLEKLRKKLGIHVALAGKIKAVVPMLIRTK
ncbi:MAG: hypothetical protein KA419_02440 [Acidobacteria bacterium]|nr:hypothetical protein [Acidobacteriota bacterium]